MVERSLIDGDNVSEIYQVCLARPGDQLIQGNGFLLNPVFGPIIYRYIKEIKQILLDLPRRYRWEYKGRRDPWLRMTRDKNGDIWTTTHRQVEELICLGVAIGAVEIRKDKVFVKC